MYNGYTAFAQGLRAKMPFPYSLLPSSSSDQDFLQNPYYNPNPNHRPPGLNGYFSRQSALLYLNPSRTFLAAAATYLATTRRAQVKLSHCTTSSGSSNCCVTVREIRCCHSHCFCDRTRSSFRDERSCNNGRGQKFLERGVTQARQVWRCNEDYGCECECDRHDLIERDVRRREKSHEHRTPNARIEEYYDYQEIDNSRQRDDYSRNFNRRRRDDYEHDYEDNERIRLIDQRGRRDVRDNEFRFSDRRRRAEYDDYEDNERIRLSDQRRRRDEYDDKIRLSDQRRRAEYDDYDEVEDVRNRDGRISSSNRMRREEHDFEEVDDYKRRRADQIKFTDQKRNGVYNERENKISVSDERRRNESYDIHGEDKVRASDQSRRDEYYDYEKEDRIRVSDRRRRDDYNGRDDKIRVSNRRKMEQKYNRAEEDEEIRREDQIRVSDRRGREVYDQRDDNIRVSDRRRRDEYCEYDNEDKIRVSDRRRRDEYREYDNEDKIRVSDGRRRDECYDYDNGEKFRVSDLRRRHVYYDIDGEDIIRVSDRRRRDENYDYDDEDQIRVSNRRRRNKYYDNEHEDKIRVSDQRRKDVYYDIDGKDETGVSELRRKELYDARDNSLRAMDKRRDEYCDYDEDNRTRVSDQRRREDFYGYNEEDKIRVLDQKGKEGHSKMDKRISISDHRSREEADDYDEVFTNLQLRGDSTRVFGSTLERQSRFKERDAASTSQISQTEERKGKYRLDSEHYDRRNFKEGSQIVKIISEDGSSLVSRERNNTVNQLTASDAQSNLQNKAQIGTQRQRLGSATSVQSQVELKNDKTNRLNQLTVSEVETDVQNRMHISTGRNQVATSSSVQSQVQVSSDKKNIVNQLGVSETELNLQNRTNGDVQRKMIGTSSSVQSGNQVAREKRNIQHQVVVSEVESDLQNRSKIEDERRKVDASISVQNVAEFTKKGHNLVDQLTASETESDVKNRTHIEAEKRRNDTSTSVQNLTQVVRDKHNIVNQLTWSEVVSNVRNMSQIEGERGRVNLDSSVDNVTQVASQGQNVVDQLSVSEVESDVQNRSQTEAETAIINTATTVQNVTEATEEKSNVESQLMLHETEVNIDNNTDVNLTRVDASTLIDNLSTVTGSGTSTASIQATGSGSERIGSSSMATGSHNATFLKGSLESASRLEKSSSYHVGQFVDSVQEELLGRSERKGPSDDVWDLKSSSSHGTHQSAGTKTENTVTGRHGRSLWAFVADIIKLGLLKGAGKQLKSGRISSSSDSRGTDDWFSGQEELDLEMKNDDEIKDEQPLIEHPSEEVSSVLISAPEVDLSVADDGTVIPTLQEKTVVEVGDHESSSLTEETANFSTSTTGVNASGVVGTAFRLGERIVEEIPKIARRITEQSTESGYDSDLGASIAPGENNTSAASSGSLLEAHISRVRESGGHREKESKRGKQLKRITQVPKSSFDEWEEEHSREMETHAIDPIGATEVLPSGVTGVPHVQTSLGATTLITQPSGAPGRPGASSSSSSSMLHVPTIGDTEIREAGGLKREKRLKRIAQVQTKSIDEDEETEVGEQAAATSGSTTVTTELPGSGPVKGHEIVGTGSSRKYLRRLSQAPRESFEEWEEAYLREKEQRRLDEFYMREALVEAQRASDAWEVPVGAVLVRNGEVIARGCNLVEELRDSTAHAEMVCIREASNLLRSWRLSDTTLYVTLEPCAMCAGAILQARIDTVVWGSPNKLLGADGSWVRLFPGEAGTSSSLEPPEPQTGPVHPFHPKITIRRGILEDECSEKMQQFFKLRRKKKSTKPEPSSTNPSCLPAHPLKFFSRFSGMFCI